MKPQPKVKAAAKKTAGQPGGRSSTPNKKKGVCYSWQSQGYCSKGESCQWDHPEDQKGQNPRAGSRQRTSSTHSTGTQGRRTSTDPELVCRLYLKGKCAKSHEQCGFIHNPTCWFFKHRNACKQGDKCLFPHRGEKGMLVSKATETAGQQALANDGKPGGPAAPNAAPASSPKPRAAAKTQIAAKATAADDHA